MQNISLRSQRCSVLSLMSLQSQTPRHTHTHSHTLPHQPHFHAYLQDDVTAVYEWASRAQIQPLGTPPPSSLFGRSFPASPFLCLLSPLSVFPRTLFPSLWGTHTVRIHSFYGSCLVCVRERHKIFLQSDVHGNNSTLHCMWTFKRTCVALCKLIKSSSKSLSCLLGVFHIWRFIYRCNRKHKYTKIRISREMHTWNVFHIFWDGTNSWTFMV